MFIERARQILEEEGLPKLKPVKLLYGYSLSYWAEEFEEEIVILASKKE